MAPSESQLYEWYQCHGSISGKLPYISSYCIEKIFKDDADSHLSVYIQVSQLRKSHQFTKTALSFSDSVFSFLRQSNDASYVFLMNLFEDGTAFSLEELLLEADISARSGVVVVRSSGNKMSNLESNHNNHSFRTW